MVDVYAGVLQLLAAGGFGSDDLPVATRPAGTAPSFADYRRVVSDEANAFRFAHDWRRDLPSTARRFHRFVISRKRHVAAIRSLHEGRAVAPSEVRLDLLAHSMGGLLTRYYLMRGTADLGEGGPLPPVTWAGAEHFRRVVFVAPPNAGSILAMENLVLGERFGPLQPVYPPALLATHPAAWQLLPRARHRRLHLAGRPEAVLDPLDPAVWERVGWGLLDRSPAGARIRALLLPDLPGDAARRARRRISGPADQPRPALPARDGSLARAARASRDLSRGRQRLPHTGRGKRRSRDGGLCPDRRGGGRRRRAARRALPRTSPRRSAGPGSRPRRTTESGHSRPRPSTAEGPPPGSGPLCPLARLAAPR